MLRLDTPAPPENDSLFNRKVREFIVKCVSFFRGWRKDGSNFYLDADLTSSGTVTAATLDATTLGSGLTEAVQDTVGAMATDSTSIDFTYNDAAGTLTAAVITEAIQDIIGALLSGGTNITVSYNDAANTLTVSLSGTVGVTNGGTGLSSAALGDILYGSAANVISALAGNTTTTKKFLQQTGNGSASAAPSWGQPAFSDVTGNAAYSQLSTGSGSWDIGSGNSLTFTRTFVAGALTASGSTRLANGGATQLLAFWGATAVARQAAFTQTYATADRTLSAYTANNQSVAYTGINNAQAGTVYAQLADLNTLRAAYENLRAFVEDLAQHHNALLDDLQLYGLCG